MVPTNLGDTEWYDHLALNLAHTRESAGQVGVFKFDEVMFRDDDAKAVVGDHRPVHWAFRMDLPDGN